jgi:bifunctional DNA-binding transcriptional regulator/antitoxin component of YhaV-PrlF toxin-antitoxin module
VAKVTSKLQVTVPKELAEQYGIEPGSDIEWQAAGDVIRVLPPGALRVALDKAERLALFDAATGRQKQRKQRDRARHQKSGRRRSRAGPQVDRGWTREELYVRGSAR